jgi:hypothetical protein
MAKLIRKISIGKDYKNDAMHYAVGQEVYGGHTICDILEEEDKFSIYIKKNNDVLPWKDFNKNMAVSVNIISNTNEKRSQLCCDAKRR